MANISAYLQKTMLDWALNAQTATRPTAWFCGLSLGTPTMVSSSEVGTNSGYVRQTGSFAPAGTVAGSSGTCTNSVAMTFGPFSSSAVISGLFISDTVSTAAGNMLFYGNLATVRTPLTGDSLVFAVGALTITLN